MLNFAIWALYYSGHLNPEAEFHSCSLPLSLLLPVYTQYCVCLLALYNLIIVNNQIKIRLWPKHLQEFSSNQNSHYN